MLLSILFDNHSKIVSKYMVVGIIELLSIFLRTSFQNKCVKSSEITKVNRDKDFYTSTRRSIRNKLVRILSLSLSLSHIHINKFTQIFDAYVHNRFRKYLASTRWKDKLEPTVLFQIFERSRAFPAISIRVNFCATFPWRVFGKIFVATFVPRYTPRCAGMEEGNTLFSYTRKLSHRVSIFGQVFWKYSPLPFLL